MPAEFVNFITAYGYLAIFLLIFSQEIGIPNPVPNELVLIFSGYLAAKKILFLPLIILTSVSADFIGTNLLYFTFFFFGRYILKRKPTWFPLSEKTIHKFSERISKGGKWSIYIGRVTPLIRGYTSVITGLLQVKPKIFLPIAFISATFWSSVCVMIGWALGPYWNDVSFQSVNLRIFALVIVLGIILIFSFRYLKRRRQKKSHQPLS